MLLELIEMMIKLFNTNSFMIGHPFLMHSINSFKAIYTNPTIEIALLIDSYEMVMFIMFEAGLHLIIHRTQQQKYKLSIIPNSYIFKTLIQRMSNQNKVQFFQSQSSFGSQSNLSQSRYYDFTNQLISDTDNIFLTLKNTLKPTDDKLQQDRIDYAIRRAKILSKDTIPQHTAYLNKISAPEDAKKQVAGCSEKLVKLISDYQKLKNGSGTMIYKQFYNLYGKQFGYKQGDFSRKPQLQDPQPNIQPEYIQINYNQRNKLKGATPRVFVAPQANNNDKELATQREQIMRLKKIIQENRKKHEEQLNNQKIVFQKRLRTYLQSQSSKDANTSSLKQQLTLKSDQFTRLLEQNKKLEEIIVQKNRQIDSLKSQQTGLQSQIQNLRKYDSNFQAEDPHNKSYNSQMNESEDKKNEKRIKNLLQENQILKSQLKSERQRFYKVQGDLTEQQRRQLERSKKNLQKKKIELEDLYLNFDKQRIQILQLNYNYNSATKMLQSIKRENNDIKQKLSQSSFHPQQKTSSPQGLLAFSDVKPNLQLSRNLVQKTTISQYDGQGIEGVPYYQNLTKQFKIRFKRACLKEKQLLYKANGVQIGVITTFQKPNKINLLIHITNYSDHKFENFKGKIMNANDNKITGSTFQYPVLEQNEQIKEAVSVTLTQYPIGPLILLIQYKDEKKQEIRILLPAHIFKTMMVEQRNQEINLANSFKHSIQTQRKICKDFNDFKTYFKIAKNTGNILKLNFFNEHTHTDIFVDLKQTNQGVQILYQHKKGSRQITQYFIKTLMFLFSKENTR